MPELYRVRLTRRAASHLQNIHDYIEKDSSRNAAKMIGKLVDAMDGLEFFPYRYNILRDRGIFGTDVRSMPVRPYLIRYHIDESAKAVTILSIRHGSRLPGL